jgi:arylsulfatase A-like enzyme
VRRIAALGLLLSWAHACGGERPPGLSGILITLDTTRADALSCYGNASARTSTLDALAAEGVLYEAAFSVAPLTLPAHASMLTGLYPVRHGLRDNGVAALPGSAETLAEAARAAGLRTAAFVSSVVLDDSFGLEQGFERYDVPPRRSADDPERRHGAERAAGATIDAALAWLAALAPDERFLLWVHLYDPHFPYAPPPPFDRELAGNPYLGEVAAMDRELGRLVAACRERGLFERSLVLVVADHGEALGEHGELTHGAYVYQSTLRVPLLARFPEGRRAGERSQEIVSLVDVLPTMAEALELPLPAGIDGQSLWSAPVPAERGVYFESYYGYLTYGWSPLAGWLDGTGKYLHSSEPELYAWREDPLEAQDLARERELEPYRRAIATVASRPALAPDPSAGSSVDEETLAGIQGLGYAASEAGGAELPHPLENSALPSPRSQRDFLVRHARAQELGEAGRNDEAAAIYEQLLRENPRNFFALDELASLRLRQGRGGEAIELLQRLVAHGPQRGKPYFELGLALRQAGRLEEACTALERAVELTNGRRRYLETLLETLEQRGLAAEARAIAERYARPRKP